MAVEIVIGLASRVIEPKGLGVCEVPAKCGGRVVDCVVWQHCVCGGDGLRKSHLRKWAMADEKERSLSLSLSVSLCLEFLVMEENAKTGFVERVSWFWFGFVKYKYGEKGFEV